MTKSEIPEIAVSKRLCNGAFIRIEMFLQLRHLWQCSFYLQSSIQQFRTSFPTCDWNVLLLGICQCTFARISLVNGLGIWGQQSIQLWSIFWYQSPHSLINCSLWIPAEPQQLLGNQRFLAIFTSDGWHAISETVRKFQSKYTLSKLREQKSIESSVLSEHQDGIRLRSIQDFSAFWENNSA